MIGGDDGGDLLGIPEVEVDGVPVPVPGESGTEDPGSSSIATAISTLTEALLSCDISEGNNDGEYSRSYHPMDVKGNFKFLRDTTAEDAVGLYRGIPTAARTLP